MPHPGLHHAIAQPLLLLLGLAWQAQASAAAVRTQLASGLPVNAEYREAAKDKPAMLVMHGFLQTYDLMATMNIVNGLAALDYAVLAPNLSFGVPDRRQSMQCNAAHTHEFNADLAELEFWIDWLQRQGYPGVILVGHSWGSQHVLGYAAQRPKAPVRGVITISLVRSHQDDALLGSQINLARQRLAQGDRALRAYQLSFCKEYMATPQSYLSYAQWNNRRVLETLAALQQRKLPVYTILGGADKRIDQAWIETLRKRVTEVSVIDGANHFFSHTSEFELNDRLESIVPKLAN